MKKHAAFALAILILAAPQHAAAQDFLDRINNMIDDVDRTMRSGERAGDTAKRLNDKMPEAGAEEEKPVTPPPATTSAAPSSGNLTQAEEDAILEQARKIEEERILKQAEEIRLQRGN